MRVCLLHIVDSPEQFGGAEKIFLTLCSELSKDGEIQIAAAVNKGVLWEKVSSFRLKTYTLPDKGISSIPSFYRNLYSIAKEFRPEIVHSHHRYTTFFSHLLPLRNYKLIHTFHLDQFTKKWNRFFGDYATAVSKACKDHFVRHFNLKEEFITVIFNGVDVNMGNITEMPFEKKDDNVIASVIGRLTEQKGHSVLIKAVSLLPADIKDNLKVIFVGDGEKRKELEKMVEEYDLKDCIEFVGYQKDVYPYIMMSDFTILPSLWEGLPLSMVESYLCGKPVVASSVGGIPEFIVDKENGLLVPHGDYQALSEVMLFLIRNKDLIRRYGEAGEKIALERFTVKKMIENYKAFYKKVLGKNNAH